MVKKCVTYTLRGSSIGYLVAPYEVPSGVAKLVFWRRISLSRWGQPVEAVGACKGLPRFQGLVAAVSQKAMTWMPEPVKWIRDLLTDQSDEP